VLFRSFLFSHWTYATAGYRLIDRDTDPTVISLAKRRILAAPLAIVISFALSFYNTRLSLFVYLLIPLYYILPGRIDRAWHPTRSQRSVSGLGTAGSD